MANFEIVDNPDFSEEIRKLEVTDKAHADVFNAFIKQLLYNTLYLKKQLVITKDESLTEAYQQSAGYTDQQIANLINGAPTTLDTLGEIAQAMQENEDVVSALNTAIGSKAAQNELDAHTGDSVIHVTTADKEKWNGISAMTQNIKAIQVVSALPSDAASHTDTLYLITE